MTTEYQPRLIEKKWQKIWEEDHYFKTSLQDSKKRKYVLEMLPYPSGKIHIGHVRNYTIGDAVARFLRLQGYCVFHPMGWDAFGLPAENAAIENNTHPADWTYQNIDEMKQQLVELGLSYDWSCEIKTCSPEYYKWTQWLFLQFYKNNLVERKDGLVNFCNQCSTVLANEQVINNHCWRCNQAIEQKKLSQWYMKITNYAQELLEDHQELKDKWPDRVLNMQHQWIGKSEGAEVIFPVYGYEETITVFTTRVDTIFGVSYLAVAYDHPFIEKMMNISSQFDHIREFITFLKDNPFDDNQEKKGIFTGFFATHPITEQSVPIYIANFVLSSYGTGAVMGVPAHDERDFEFAEKYDLPLYPVIQKADQSISYPMTEKGTLINSDEFNHLTSEEAQKAITQKLEQKNLGRSKTQYKLKDWLISRQRYWGTPIPIIHCKTCGAVPIPEEELPVLLPDDVQFSVGENPLHSSSTFKNVKCPKCQEPAERETDTMDTFMDSCWYFIRYLNSQEDQKAIHPDITSKWLPVNLYIGGIEHAVMHLLYARFFYKVLRQLKLVPNNEPFQTLITQGMVIAPSYYCPSCKQYKEESQREDTQCKACSHVLDYKMEKMSKSKKNGVNPSVLNEQFGVDAVRIFILFAAPIDRDLEWSYHGVSGSLRFLKRVYHLCCSYTSISQEILNPESLNSQEVELWKLFHKTINKVTYDIQDKYQFNTAIAHLMEFLNELTAFQNARTDINHTLMITILKDFCILLFPLAPHLAEECYSYLQDTHSSIYDAQWPIADPQYLIDNDTKYVIQINGKVKLTIQAKKDMTLDEMKALLQKEHAAFYEKIQESTIKKEIFVPNKIVNFVL